MKKNNFKSVKLKRGVIIMAQTKKVMRSVTIRVPKDLYEDYKRVLHKDSRIVTYDLRNYMQKIVDEDLVKK